MIYLDSAATSLLKPRSVPAAVLGAVRSMASPGRGGHKPALLAAETAYDCRCLLAELFSAPGPENVVFTMNATHALNIALSSLVSGIFFQFPLLLDFQFFPVYVKICYLAPGMDSCIGPAGTMDFDLFPDHLKKDLF